MLGGDFSDAPGPGEGFKSVFRVKADGSLDAGFNDSWADGLQPGVGLDSSVSSVVWDGSGYVIGGYFGNAPGAAGTMLNRAFRVIAEVAPVIGSVTLAGELAVGQVVTGSAQGVTGSPAVSLSWQWQRSADAAGWAAIAGATSSSYQLTSADAGQFVRVVATAGNGVSPDAVVASDARGPVSAGSVPPGPLPLATKSAQHLRRGAMPARVKRNGVTVLNKRKAKTREGRPVSAKARVLGSAGKACARVVKKPKRKLKIRTHGQCSFRLRVIYRAPGTAEYKALKVKKIYRVRR